MVCDPETDYVVEATKEFTAELFADDLNRTCEEFRCWNEEIHNSSNGFIGSFEVRVSKKIGNISITFIDPRDPNGNGQMLLTPTPYQMAPHSKPCVWFDNKSHKEIFRLYYTAYDVIWRKARKLV